MQGLSVAAGPQRPRYSHLLIWHVELITVSLISYKYDIQVEIDAIGK
jgi:hypothetical protein